MRCLSLFMILLLAAAPAIASGTSGEVTLGGRFVGGNNTKTSAKFLEYRDIRNQATSDINVFNSNGNFYLSGEAKNVGYNDQEYLIEGGHFGKGKFSLWYDELRHNYSLDNKTLHTGTGTGNLVIGTGVVPADVTTWLTHDFKVDRQQVGADFELNFGTPFFFAGEVTQTKKDGTYPIAVQDSGRNPIEIPAAIDYTTNNFLLKAGYRTEKVFAQVDTLFSTFKNGADLQEWQTTAGGAGTTYTLAPDNDSVQIGGQLTVRDLPVKSVFSVRGSYAKNESTPTLPALAGTTTWKGEQSYTNLAASLKSKPFSKLTTKLAYHYTKKDNDSPVIDYRDGNDSSETLNHTFRYTKHGVTLDGTYRLNRTNRLKAGYGFENVKRPEMRHDAEKTDTHRLFAEWKNSSLDRATSKLRYERLMRSSDFKGAEFADMFGPQASEEIARYSRPFDAADKDQDTISWKLALIPAEMLDLGLELAYSKSDYSKTVIGRTEDTGQSILLDASVQLPMSAVLYAYAEYDQVELSSNHVRFQNNNATRHIDAGVPVAAADENTNRYNWNVKRKDVGTSFGVKCDLPLLKDRLKLSAGYDFQKNDGEADFSSAFQTANGTPLEKIKAYDDYEMQTIKLTGKYAVRENMTLILGYTYEKFEQSDIRTNDYQHIVSGDQFYSGAYANNDYEANIGTVALSYKF